jgi:hypothetical protein
MTVEGDPIHADIRISLDAAVQEISASPVARCELLSPRPSSRVAEQVWSPLDLYANVRNSSEQQDNASTLGETDVYFPGDDGNRNGGTDGASWTMAVAPFLLDSLDFLQRHQTESAFDFVLGFTRGGLHYQGMYEVRTEYAQDHCGAALYRCTQSTDQNASTSCSADGWTEQVQQVIAVADKWGAVGDEFRHFDRDRERNDLSSLDAVVTDANGTRRETLAKK